MHVGGRHKIKQDVNGAVQTKVVVGGWEETAVATVRTIGSGPKGR